MAKYILSWKLEYIDHKSARLQFRNNEKGANDTVILALFNIFKTYKFYLVVSTCWCSSILRECSSVALRMLCLFKVPDSTLDDLD